MDPSSVAHAVVLPVVLERRPALAGHAAFETFSVLTRLPSSARLASIDAATLLAANFPDPCFLGARETSRFLQRAGEIGIVGGAIYDALVAAAALHHGRTLLSVDHRAARTYQAVGASYELLA